LVGVGGQRPEVRGRSDDGFYGWGTRRARHATAHCPLPTAHCPLPTAHSITDVINRCTLPHVVAYFLVLSPKNCGEDRASCAADDRVVTHVRISLPGSGIDHGGTEDTEDTEIGNDEEPLMNADKTLINPILVSVL
jgi:hypothetical protein